MTIYMKIDGIEPSDHTQAQQGWIKIESANIRVLPNQKSSQQPPQGMWASNTCNDVQLTKLVGARHPALSEMVHAGQAVPKIQFDICDGMERHKPHTSYVLSNVVIKALSGVTTGQASQSLEVVSLQCHNIEKQVKRA